MKIKNSNQIKPIEKVETIPQLSEKVIATEHAKLLPAYYILHEAFKDKPFVKLSIAKDYISHYLDVSTKTAYAYLETACPFWAILPKIKDKNKCIKLISFAQICAVYKIFPVKPVLQTVAEYFNGSISLRNASLFQNAICKRGSVRIIDNRGVFGRDWIKQKNGKMKPMSTSVGEMILQRTYNYPVCRDTIETRTGVPRSTQKYYGKVLKLNHTTFQTFYNFALIKEISETEYVDIKNKNCDQQLLEKIMDATGCEPLGEKFKVRNINDCYFITEQLPNSYQDFVECVSPNKIRKLNHRIKKLMNNCQTLYKKVNNFWFGPRFKDDGYYYEGAKTLRPNIKEAFWIKITNCKREVFSQFLNFKDYVYKDLKQYLYTSITNTDGLDGNSISSSSMVY